MIGHRVRTCLLITIALLLVAPAVQGVATVSKVQGGQGSQFYPFADASFLVYSNYAGQRDVAMALKRSTGFAFRLNETGTSGEAGGIDPAAETAIYQQFVNNTSSIWLYDLEARTRQLAPGVNSSSWEWGPRMSASYITFFRNAVRSGARYVDLFVYGRDTHVLRRITTFKWNRYANKDGSLFLFNGGVTDGHAFWQACATSDGNCNAFVYDLESRTTTKVTGGGDKQEYGIAVDETAGSVYFTRSGSTCGRNVNVWRLPIDHLAAAPTKVVDLPDGYDTGWVASVAPHDEVGGTDYYFERGYCQNWNADVYVAKSVDLV
jgi:hypothetical protein